MCLQVLTKLPEGLHRYFLSKLKVSSKGPWTHCETCNRFPGICRTNVTFLALHSHNPWSGVYFSVQFYFLPLWSYCLLADPEYSLAHVILWSHSKKFCYVLLQRSGQLTHWGFLTVTNPSDHFFLGVPLSPTVTRWVGLEHSFLHSWWVTQLFL